MARDLLCYLHSQNIVLSVSHISTDLNVLADRLSSPDHPVPAEWKLDPEIFREITAQLFLPQVDLFATRWNNQLPLFVSPCPDQQAMHNNALTLDWNQFHTVYLYPPEGVLMQAIERLQSFMGQALVVAPLNTTKLYHNSLVQLLTGHPRQLPPQVDTLL